MEELKNQPCPFCHKKTLTLIEEEKEIPYFGKCFLMPMSCGNCKYHKFDIESAETKEIHPHIVMEKKGVIHKNPKKSIVLETQGFPQESPRICRNIKNPWRHPNGNTKLSTRIPKNLQKREQGSTQGWCKLSITTN